MSTPETITTNKKKNTPILFVFLAGLACCAAVLLIGLAIVAATSAPIDIDSVKAFDVTYYPNPDENVYCVIDADFETGTITVDRWAETTEYITVSGSDVAEANTYMQQETQTFSNLDMTELEQYIIEHDTDLLVNDYAYDMSSVEDRKVMCDITVQTDDGEYYHMEWLTTLPDNWPELVELVKQTTGSIIEL